MPLRGLACMDPRGKVGRIYKEDDIYTLLYTKYESFRPCGFRDFIFYVFPIVSLCELMTPGVGTFLTPGTWLAGCIKRTTKRCYTQNMQALGLVVLKNFLFMFFQ